MLPSGQDTSVRPNSRRRRVSVAAAAVAVVLILSGCTPTLPQQKVTVDKLLAESADSFAAKARQPSYRASHATLDFSTDGCSNWFLPDHMNDTGATYDFTTACWHHDFGYRNYRRFKAGGLVPNPEGSRGRLDAMFLADMDANCAPRPAWQRPTCYARADLYHWLVRTYGSL